MTRIESLLDRPGVDPTALENPYPKRGGCAPLIFVVAMICIFAGAALFFWFRQPAPPEAAQEVMPLPTLTATASLAPGEPTRIPVTDQPTLTASPTGTMAPRPSGIRMNDPAASATPAAVITVIVTRIVDRAVGGGGGGVREVQVTQIVDRPVEVPIPVYITQIVTKEVPVAVYTTQIVEVTRIVTATPSPTPSETATATPTQTNTPTETATPTATATETATGEATEESHD